MKQGVNGPTHGVLVVIGDGRVAHLSARMHSLSGLKFVVENRRRFSTANENGRATLGDLTSEAA